MPLKKIASAVADEIFHVLALDSRRKDRDALAVSKQRATLPVTP